ncbi:MAG: ATP-binding protein [Alphaproteobacteria bacterium]|nr:ATP-binding protein [Alphaproteobacteria bacterium]
MLSAGHRGDYSRRAPSRAGAFQSGFQRDKFTPPGGSIRVSAERQADELLLTVADTGIGTTLPGPARTFTKLASGTIRSGAGLGLSLVKSLFELHGGSVAIDTAANQGTTIVCRLPATEADFVGITAAEPVESRQAA